MSYHWNFQRWWKKTRMRLTVWIATVLALSSNKLVVVIWRSTFVADDSSKTLFFSLVRERLRLLAPARFQSPSLFEIFFCCLVALGFQRDHPFFSVVWLVMATKNIGCLLDWLQFAIPRYLHIIRSADSLTVFCLIKNASRAFLTANRGTSYENELQKQLFYFRPTLSYLRVGHP